MSDLHDIGEIEKKKQEGNSLFLERQELFENEQQNSLNEQKQRFLQAKENKIAKAKAKAKKQILPEMANREELRGVLQDGRAAVEENLPKEKDQPWNKYPRSMRNLMGRVYAWNTLKKGTSEPLKKAVIALKNSNTEEDAAKAFSIVIMACLNYLNKNEGKMFKSSVRKELVRDLLESMSDYMAKADFSYYQSYTSIYEKHQNKLAGKRSEEFQNSVEDKMKKEEGLEDFQDVLALKNRLVEDKKLFDAKTNGPERKAAKLREKQRKEAAMPFTTKEERLADFKALRKKTPELKAEGYMLYDKFKNALNYKDHPEYNAIYHRAKKNYKGTGMGTFTREAANLLRSVNFDRNNQPVSEVDRENHEWNLRVLRAFERDNFDTQEDLIAEQLPKTMDGMELPMHITEDEIRSYINEKDKKKKAVKWKVLKKRILAWVDDYLKNGDANAYAQFALMSLGFDSMKQLHPGVDEYYKNNPAFAAKYEACDALTTLIGQYTEAKYFVNISTGLHVFETSHLKGGIKHSIESMEQMADAYIEDLLEKLLTLHSTKDFALKPYDASKHKKNPVPAEEEKAPVEEKKELSAHDKLLKSSVLSLTSRQTKAAEERLKKNTTINKEVSTNKEKNARTLDMSVKMITDEKCRLRKNTPLDIKKKIDYRTLMDLSDFAVLSGGQKELNRLISFIATARKKEAQPEQADKMEQAANKDGYLVLDYMISQLMKVDASTFDISSDEAIAQNAVSLEKLSHAMEAFQKFYKEFGGEEYFTYLSEKKLEGVDTDLGQTALTQLERLSSISKYYRARRLVIEDEGYQKAKEEIKSEPGEADDFEMKRLKELQRYANEQEAVLGGLTSDKKKTAKEILEEMGKGEQTLHRLEEERYFVAPEWLKNAFSLTDIKDRIEDPDPSSCAHQNSDVDTINMINSFEQNGTSDHQKAFSEVQKKLKTQNHRFDSSPKFSGGKSEILASGTLSENLDRISAQIVNSFSYRRTAEETREMMEAFAIQKTEEWDKIKKDPEAVAYYESYFAEMIMRHIASVYATLKRVCNGVGTQILVMHPIDMAMQMTLKLRVALLGAILGTNIDTKEAVQLFAEFDKDGRYLFDAEDFNDLESVAGNATYKCVNGGDTIMRFAFDDVGNDDFNPESEMTADDIRRQLFGTDQVAAEGEKLKQEEIRKLQKQAEKDPKARKRLEEVRGFKPESVFLMKHPEIYTRKNYLAKDDTGNYILMKGISENSRTLYSRENMPGIKTALEKKKLRPISEKELNDYEKSLKERNMPYYMIEEDPYGLEIYRQKLDPLIKKDENGKPVYKNGKLEMTPPSRFKSINPVTGKAMEE